MKTTIKDIFESLASITLKTRYLKSIWSNKPF